MIENIIFFLTEKIVFMALWILKVFSIYFYFILMTLIKLKIEKGLEFFKNNRN